MMRQLLLALALIAAPLPAGAQDIAVRTVAEADGSRTLVHETVLPAPPEQIWAAIATAEGWKSWAVPVAWAPEADVIETSYAATAVPGDATTIRQRILARIPNRLLVFATVRAPQGFPHFDVYAKVTSFFELAPVAEGTRLRLTQTGYPASQAGDRLLGFFTQGNRESLEMLRTRFRDGPVDWSKRVAAPKGN